MPIDIESAVRTGFDRTIARNGLLLAGLVFVVTTVNAFVGFGVANWARDSGLLPPNVPFPAAMGGPAISPAVGGLVSTLAGLAMIVLTIGALRTFVTDETASLPSEYFTRNLLWPGLNFLVGIVVFGILVGIGFVLFIVPGIFLLVTLVFWTVSVAVDGTNFVAGMGNSWSLTRGHRVRLFLLGVVVVLIEVVVEIVFGVPGGVLGVVLTQVGSALTTVFGLATLAATYNQLVELPAPEGTAAAESEGPTPA